MIDNKTEKSLFFVDKNINAVSVITRQSVSIRFTLHKNIKSHYIFLPKN